MKEMIKSVVAPSSPRSINLGLLLLRIKKKEVSKETSKAMQTFSNMISALSSYFHRIEQGKAEF